MGFYLAHGDRLLLMWWIDIVLMATRLPMNLRRLSRLHDYRWRISQDYDFRYGQGGMIFRESEYAHWPKWLGGAG